MRCLSWIVCITLLFLTAPWAIEASAADCPPGTHKETVGEQDVSMEYTFACVPDDVVVDEDDPRNSGSQSDSKGKSSKTTGERFCRVGSQIEGISPDEMYEGNLIINGNRWVRCPRGTTTLDADSMTLDLDALARSLAVQLRLPDATPIFSPDPNNNEWKMLAVGFPIWLRTEGPDTKSTTASTQGLTFRLSATRTSTNFAMGDGKTITCTAMARYSESVKAGSPSPNCGHAYQQPSGKKDRYTVTGTHHWTVTWSVDSFSGSFPMSYSDSSTIRIGELSALNR